MKWNRSLMNFYGLETWEEIFGLATSSNRLKLLLKLSGSYIHFTLLVLELVYIKHFALVVWELVFTLLYLSWSW